MHIASNRVARPWRINPDSGRQNRRIYKIWHHMVDRCRNPKVEKFHCYGGRGIKVCEEWKTSFPSFLAWARTSGYESHLTIERKDVNGNYEPSNCCWATWEEQHNNKRTNRVLSFNGRSLNVTQWSKNNEIGLTKAALTDRVNKYGWSAEKALTTPLKAKNSIRIIEYNGKSQLVSDWAKEIGVRLDTLQLRLKRGLPLSKALSSNMPKDVRKKRSWYLE